jgi:5-deoxy-glucuronate isomerase
VFKGTMKTNIATPSEKMVFRRTNRHEGRHLAVTPENSTMRHLAYGRIRLNVSVSNVSFDNRERETGLILLSGLGIVRADGREFELGQYDAIYIPRDSKIEVSTKSEVDIAEFSSDVEGKYPLKIVRYAETSQDPGMKFSAGGPGSSRQLNMLIAKNVEAGRLVAGPRMNTRKCWRRFMSTSTCPNPRMESSWFTTTRSIRNWLRSCATATRY